MQICGIDEAGRGALAGPLVVAACVLNTEISGLNDSKKLTAKTREKLFKQIIKNSNFLIAYFDNTQVDELGLSECLRRALLCFRAHFASFELLFDGNTNYNTGIKTLIKADASVAEVAAASILAKVSRDKLMDLYDQIYPDYGYKNHKGYGTSAHIDAICTFGQNELTRKSFKLKPREKTLFGEDIM